MATLVSKLNPRSEDAKANAAAMRALVDDLNAKLAKIAEGGGEAARAKHLGRGVEIRRIRPGRVFEQVRIAVAIGVVRIAAGRRIRDLSGIKVVAGGRQIVADHGQAERGGRAVDLPASRAQCRQVGRRKAA